MGNCKSKENNKKIDNKKMDDNKLKKIQKMIIVDDVKIMSEIMKDYFTLKNYDIEIICLTSGDECIKVMEKNKDIDIIFMDLIMYPMSGYDTAKNILKTQKIKIVALTGMVDKESIEICKKIGFIDIIQKPIDYEKIIEKVKNYGLEFVVSNY